MRRLTWVLLLVVNDFRVGCDCGGPVQPLVLDSGSPDAADDGGLDGGDDAGSLDSGARDSGTIDSGPADSGAPDSGLSQIVDLAAGGGSACVVLRSGAVKCWGSNSN